MEDRSSWTHHAHPEPALVPSAGSRCRAGTGTPAGLQRRGVDGLSRVRRVRVAPRSARRVVLTGMTMACRSCGRELAGDFSFCPYCAAPLVEQPAASVREERKVVSVLFCDLVGFTAASDAADPEDVRARIRPYHERLRRDVERHGGA